MSQETAPANDIAAHGQRMAAHGVGPKQLQEIQIIRPETGAETRLDFNFWQSFLRLGDSQGCAHGNCKVLNAEIQTRNRV
jgi:hypothetical protein